jgi:hypothetical protein
MAFKEGTGVGTKLEVESATTPGTFETLGRIKNINGPNLTVNIIEKTTLDDTYARKAAGRIDGGEVTFDLEHDPTEAGHKGIVAKIKGRGVHNFKITLPAPWDSVFTFSGILSSFQPTIDDTEVAASVTIAVTGEPDFGEAP